MRKITQNAVNAFYVGRKFSDANTLVTVTNNEVSMFLHGNCIAKRAINSYKVFICDAGWMTVTTKDRLNGILDVYGKNRIYQKNFEWFWKDGKPFHQSSWQEI